jgi:O-antigen/teichoic acid export membrane protein
MGAQVSQAVASFALQLLAARDLGARGLGLFALLYGGIVLATALSTGFVGDSLTVLDRSQPSIRSGLQRWLLAISAFAGIVGAVVVSVTGLVSWRSALLYAIAMAVFMIEDALRRLLMALLRFWYIVAVDTTSLVVSIAFLAVVRLTGHHLKISDFLVALVLGQIAATVVAVPLLVQSERWIAPWRPAKLREVMSFGVWRGMQQGLRPSTLQIMRTMVVAAAGTVAFGQLEAARVYMAPALLIVQGAGSFLFAMYARTRDLSLRQVMARADRATVALLFVSIGLGALAALGAHALGPLITGGKYALDRRAVFGWAMYAASSAAALPFASLGAVRGRQVRVLLIRALDSSLSVALVALLVFAAHAPLWLAPYGLAVGPFVGAAIIRQRVLRPAALLEESGLVERCPIGEHA